jgi:hypothetical protein
VSYQLVKDTKSITTAKALIEKVLPIFPSLRGIITDKASTFTSNVWKELTRIMHWKHASCAALNSQFNARCERAIEDLNRGISLYGGRDENIGDILPLLELHSRVSVNRSIGYSPFHIVFGYQPSLNLPGDVTHEVNTPLLSHNEYIVSLNERLKTLQTCVNENKLRSKELQKEYFDKVQRVREPQFKMGDSVWLERLQIRSHSPNVLTHQRFVGPYFISSVVERQVSEGDGTSPYTDLNGSSFPRAYQLCDARNGRFLKHLVPAKRL